MQYFRKFNGMLVRFKEKCLHPIKKKFVKMFKKLTLSGNFGKF